MCINMFAQVGPLPTAEVRAAAVHVTFAGQAGSDGGGLRRHCFTEFGKGLECTWAAASRPGATLFKLTDAGNLTPASAETLAGRVGDADEHGAIVPTLDETLVERYRACGRACGLALVNECPLGLRFAHYFLRALLGEPPSNVEELQSELRLEEPSCLDRPAFLEQTLSEQGLSGVLTLERQVTSAAPGAVGAPLAPQPDMPVTNENKGLYLERTLRHKLVLTIAQQADAFRRGCQEVVGEGCLPRFSADELAELWGGHEVDDAALATWREHTTVSPEVAQQAEYFWTWLEGCTPRYRAQVLQFVNGRSRIAVDTRGWAFEIGPQSSEVVLQPSASNGRSRPVRLALTHACGHGLLNLPPWESLEELADGMQASITYGGGGFGVH